MPHITPLTIHLFEPPNLISRPPIANAFRQRLHMLPFHIIVPRLQKVVVVNIRQLDPPALAFDFAEDLVFVLAPGVVEDALFLGAADAAGGYLGDVNVGVFFGGVVDVLGYGEGDGGIGDGFAEEPGYALLVRVLDRDWITVKDGEKGYHLEDTIVIVGEGFVLKAC